MEKLRQVAQEALNTFEAISHAAEQGLRDKGLSLDSLATVNQFTTETMSRDMRERNAERLSDYTHLRREPTIARLVVSDDDDRKETLYISPVGTVDADEIISCSYLSPKGRLASLRPGEGDEIRLPGGKRWFYVLEKVTFQPGEWGGQWDSRPAVEFRENATARTITSLREFLHGNEGDRDALSHWLEGDDDYESGLIVDGVVREALTAMQLRVKQLLDGFQDTILRLPLDSRIAVLGPPGTGKTTTMIKRLRRTADIRHLDEDEQQLVMKPGASGLDHPDSWIMFTPTELLRLYIKEALGKQGVPVHDQRLCAWDNYRFEIAKRELALLRTAARRGFGFKSDAKILRADTLTDQIAWFEAFNAFQKKAFIGQLAIEAKRLAASGDVRLALVGRQMSTAIERHADSIVQLIGDLAGRADDLREIAAGMAKEIQSDLERPLDSCARSPGFLDALSDFVGSLSAEAEEETDEEAEDDEEEVEEQRTLTGRRHVADVFRKAMRARAIGQASGRTLGVRTRAGKVLAFVSSRGLELPDLKAVGERLLMQRAARRLARAPHNWLSGVSLRYRQFRRAQRIEGVWYAEAHGGAMDIQAAELDLLVFAILSQAREMSANTLLMSRLGENRPTMLDAVASLRRNQVLVDEATDFSPLQLAAMRALADIGTDAVFISGDFNQRLTIWGSRSTSDLAWAVPDMEFRPISVTYRQSRKLASFAGALAALQGASVEEKAPEDLQNNDGWDPVLGVGLADLAGLSAWLAARIREISILTPGAMPTIALLVDDEAQIDDLAAALNPCLEDLSLRAVACPRGLVKGQDGDIRIFDVQHVKGLEFEAVFFIGLDGLASQKPDLFDRYLYVGTTRAATFLGLTVAGNHLPEGIRELEAGLLESWPGK